MSKGWITLEGDVDWAFERDDAERLVRRLTGVRGGTNLITVKYRPMPSERGRGRPRHTINPHVTEQQRLNNSGIKNNKSGLNSNVEERPFRAVVGFEEEGFSP